MKSVLTVWSCPKPECPYVGNGPEVCHVHGRKLVEVSYDLRTERPATKAEAAGRAVDRVEDFFRNAGRTKAGVSRGPRR